ncbi:MAG: cytochrome c [bacterium]|nr:cytochrome c [bacterium]
MQTFQRLPKTLLLCFFAINANAGDNTSEVQSIMQRMCAKCHSGPSAKAGVDVSDMPSLIKDGWVTPKNISESTLWDSITREEDPMPKGGVLSGAERSAILEWILQGAPTTKKQLPPVRPWSHWFAAAARHLDAYSDEAKDIRFLCVPETLQDAQLSQVPDLVHYVLSYLARKSSKGKPLPMAVKGEPRLVAFHLSTYGLEPIDWDVITFSSMVVPVQSSWNWERAKTKTPILFLTEFGSTAFYHPVYPVIKRHTMTWQEMLVDMNADKDWAEQQGTRSRWTTLTSGVSSFPRILDRYPNRSGDVTIWESDDFASASREANPIAHPFSVSAIRDGSEMVMFRDDRLPEFYLADDKGNLIHQGPITVVSDARQPSLHVALGKSCASCHSTGTVPVDDYLRSAVSRFSFAYASLQIERTLRLHRSSQQSDALVQKDAHQFLGLMKKLEVKPESAVLLQRLVEEQAELATMDRLSRILGVQPSAIENALDSNAELARHLGTLVTGPGISWEVVEDKLPQLLLSLGLPVASLKNPMMEQGWRKQEQNRYEQAHLSFQWASLLDPDDAASFAAANRSQPKVVIARCERILKENPRDRVTRFVLARVLRSIGEYERAADQVRYATTY